jgi:hypothetical protein
MRHYIVNAKNRLKRAFRAFKVKCYGKGEMGGFMGFYERTGGFFIGGSGVSKNGFRCMRYA